MNRLGQLRLGPLQFNLSSIGDEPVIYHDPAYTAFWSDVQAYDSAGLMPLRSMEIELVSHPESMPASEPDYRAGRNWAFWSDDGGVTICAGYHGRALPRVHLRADIGLRRAELRYDASGLQAGEPHPFSYPVDQILSWALLGELSGVLLHGALIEREGRAWVVAGRSGAGKSTLSGLCHAEGWHILNDDRSIIFVRDGVVFAAGNPWHGSGRFAEPGVYPLGGIFLIEKALTESVLSLSTTEARYRLLDVASVPWFQSQWSGAALSAVEGLAHRGFCRRFAFTRTSAAAHALGDAMRETVAA